MSPNQGQVWNLMAGGIGNPLILASHVPAGTSTPPPARPPTAPRGGSSWPCPPRPATPCRSQIYAGGSTRRSPPPTARFFGLFMTKDFGQNWTKVRIPTLPPGYRDPVQPGHRHQRRQPADYPIMGGNGTVRRQGNYDIAPGGRPDQPQHRSTWEASRDGNQTGLIRIDTTNIWDAHNLTAFTEQPQRRRCTEPGLASARPRSIPTSRRPDPPSASTIPPPT